MNETESGSVPSIVEKETKLRESRGRHFVRAAVVGTLAGSLGVLYAVALFHAERARESLLVLLHSYPYWGWAVLPTIGLAVGSFIGWSTRRFCPEAAGSGIPQVKAVLLSIRELHWRTLVPIKFVTGVLGLGIGLSLGREGPTVQLGAACGRAVAEVLGVRRRAVPQLVAVGAGAGLAAAFNAPLAGFIFVLEELQREMSPLTYGGALVAAVCADVVTRWFTGQVPSFNITGYPALPLSVLPIVAVLGAAAGVGGVVFNRSLVGALGAAQRVRRVPAWALPGVVGVAVGVVAWWLPDAVGGGHLIAEQLLSGQYSGGLTALVVLLVAKYVLTVLSYGSGAPGGIFAPMLVIGAIMGLLTGRGVEAVFPSLTGTASAFAVLGMAAFFASSVRAPLTGIVLILEMTANYEQLFSLSVACLVAYLVAERLRDRPIYEALLERDLHRSGHGPADAEPTQVTVSVHHGSSLEGKTLREAALPGGCLVVVVRRGGREIVPRADLRLIPGDHMTVLIPGEAVGAALEIVRLAQNF